MRVRSCAVAAVLLATGCGSPAAEVRTTTVAGTAASVADDAFEGALVATRSTGATVARLPGVSLATSDGQGGWFVERHLGARAGGRGCLARVRPDAAIDARWRAPLPMQRCETDALLTVGSRLFAGGRIPTADSGRRRALVALDARTGALLPWRPSLPSGARVRDLATWRGTLYVRYELGADPARAGIAALDARTGARLGWKPSPAVLQDADDPGASVRSLAVRDGVVYLGFGGRVLALDGLNAGLVWRSERVDEGTLGIVLVAGRSVYASGWHSALTRIDRATGRLLRDRPRIRGSAAAVGRAGSTIYAISGVEWGWRDWGGDTNEGRLAPALAIDDRTGRLKQWTPQLAAWTLATAVVPSGSRVLVAGTFDPTP